MRGELGVATTVRAPAFGGSGRDVSGRVHAAVWLFAVLAVALILLGHVALDRSWLVAHPAVPAVIRAFAAAVALGIGLFNLAAFVGRRREATLIVGTAFTGMALILIVRLTLHVMAYIAELPEYYQVTTRIGFAQSIYLPLVLLAGVAWLPDRGDRIWDARHTIFVAAAAALLAAGVVGPWQTWFPGALLEERLVARPDASWPAAAYIVLLALVWRRPDLSATLEGRWLVFALYLGFLNQTLIAPFWHAAAGSAAALDASALLAKVVVAGVGVMLGAAQLARAQAGTLDRLRSEAEERARVEEAFARHAARLKVANEELAQYAYLASHDLQEPLRMVTNYLQLIERRYADALDDDGREFIHFAVDGAVRMKRLTNDLLLYSRVSTEPIDPTPADAGAAFDAARQNLEVAIAEADAEVTRADLPTVRMDGVQLIQLFQNLIANALKFRREGVRPRVHASSALDGEEFRFAVRDNGIGIDERYHDRVFGVFQRLHRGDTYPGSGIGLALCRKIVERHGGRIWMESFVGEGTTFHWSVPVSPPAVEPRVDEADDEFEERVTTLIERARELM